MFPEIAKKFLSIPAPLKFITSNEQVPAQILGNGIVCYIVFKHPGNTSISLAIEQTVVIRQNRFLSTSSVRRKRVHPHVCIHSKP